MRRFAKLTSLLIAAAALAVVASGCAWVKPGSLSGSQPTGIGDVRVHFDICSINEEGAGPQCGPSGEAGPSETVQYLAGIAVPVGSAPPASFTATPVGGGAPIVFTRNDSVAAEMAAAGPSTREAFSALEEGLDPEVLEVAKGFLGVGLWPPAGLQGFGYISAPVEEKADADVELSLDADFGLPPTANGTPYTGPFKTAIAFGIREVGDGTPASRPVRCARINEPGAEPEAEAQCSTLLQEAQIGTSDLKIGGSAPVQAFVGGEAALSFPLNFATTNPKPPSFALSATTNAPGATVALGSGIFTPGAPNPVTHLAPAGAAAVGVDLPTKGKPGAYQVTFNATTLQGATVAATGTLIVTSPKLKLGKLKRNRAKGTATLKVRVPATGQLIASGKGVKKVRKTAKEARGMKVRIAPRGRTARRLAKNGKAKVRVKVKFKPSSGDPVWKKKSIVLRRRPAKVRTRAHRNHRHRVIK